MNIKFLTFFMMSVLLFSLKAEDTKISNCGNRLNIVMKYDPEKKSASLENFIFSNDQFCDLGTNETKANFDVILLDKNNKIVNQKSIYFNTMEVIESFKSRSSSQFGKTKLLQTPQYRLLSFSVFGKAESITNYKIISKADNKISGVGVVSEK
jgi:hypothetical protein